jgi:hypothetical protein
MSIATINECVILIDELSRVLPSDDPLRKRARRFLREHDYVEGVGVYEVGDTVFFDPSSGGKLAIHAKVLANYGLADGRVLYDLAVSFDGGNTFLESIPMRDIVPAFIRSLCDANVHGIEPMKRTVLPYFPDED